MSFFKSPSSPKPPPLTPAPSPEAQKAEVEARKLISRRRGHGSTIATSGLGLPGVAPVSSPMLV